MRAARVMSNVISEPISKKSHELMQSYLKGPRQTSPQEVNWVVPFEKSTDLTREMRNIGVAGDGYMAFRDTFYGNRKTKGLRTKEDFKPEFATMRQTRQALNREAPIPDKSFIDHRMAGEIPLDDYHLSHNNRAQSWKNTTRRWVLEYEDRAEEKPFIIGRHTSIADLKRDEDKVVHLRNVSHLKAKGPGVGVMPIKSKKKRR